MGRRATRAPLLALAIAVSTAAGCSTAPHAAPRPASPSRSASAGAAPSATLSPAAYATLPARSATRWTGWCHGDGYMDLQGVAYDMTQLMPDLRNGDYGSAAHHGTILYQDAAAAAANLPPGTDTQKLDYGLYMGFLMTAGSKMSNGDITGAMNAISKATPYKNVVRAIAGRCT